MKVVCVYSRKQRKELHFPGNDFYGLEEVMKYLVMGINCEDNEIEYFVDILGRPEWAPHFLFKIKETKIPYSWHINIMSYASRLYNMNKTKFLHIMGYYELCTDLNHFNGLFEREENALQIFYERKREIEADFL